MSLLKCLHGLQAIPDCGRKSDVAPLSLFPAGFELPRIIVTLKHLLQIRTNTVVHL